MISVDPPATARSAPGRLVLVVGPSGAGKDTLIDALRRTCATDPAVVFPRRVVTRPSSAAEDHDTISDDAFDRAVTGGAFAMQWSAHGLKYGIPRAIEDDLHAGRTVVCNVSRTVVGKVRERYANVVVVLVTAPPDVLAARLHARARGTDGAIADRIRRSTTMTGDIEPDIVIENVGTVESATAMLLRAIADPHVMHGP